MATSLNDVYKQLLVETYTGGIETSPRGKVTRELVAARIKLDPRDNIVTLPGFETSLEYASAELAWYLSGTNDFRKLCKYAKVWEKYSDDGETVNSAYGFQMLGNHPDCHGINQLQWIEDELKRDTDSRRCVVNINFPVHKRSKLDVPCLHGGTRIHSPEHNYTIAKLARMFASGKIKQWPIWSFNTTTNEVELDWMTAAWKKDKLERLVTITFNDGKLLCTPDHLILVRHSGKKHTPASTSWVKAKKLKPGDVIVRMSYIETKKAVCYVKRVVGAGWKFSNQGKIASDYWEFANNSKLQTNQDIHHINLSQYDNAMSNLLPCLHSQHTALHQVLNNMNTKVHVNLIDRQRFQKRNFDLVKQHTKKMIVVNVKHEYKNHVVYDFMSEKNHNAFANNGACVHNCTIALQFLVREGELICLAYMRSNDLYYGFRNDVYCFTEMQKMLAKRLGVGIGPYYHIAGSLHLYEKELVKVRDAFQLESKRKC